MKETLDAMRLLVVLLLAQTTASLLSDLDLKYRLVNESVTWDQAQSYCRGKFTDLATVTNEEEQARVTQLVFDVSETSRYVWFGLYDDVDSWRWSLDSTSLDGTGAVDWFVFHRDNNRSQEHCAFMLRGELHDGNCEDSLTSVCYDEPTKTYILVSSPNTWKSAQSYCRQTHTDLASVRNLQEMEDIKNMIDFESEWWIGLSRETWKWSDHSDSSFSKWGGREPNNGRENCGCAFKGGWNDCACHSKLPYICSVEVKMRKMVAITLKSGGNLDLNDPQIQEAILKQVEKRMRDQGVQQEFKLAWKKQPNGRVFNETSAKP